MKADAVILGIAGALFGVVVGWLLGAQQQERAAPPATAAAPAQAPAQGGGTAKGGRAPAVLDSARVQQLESKAAAAPGDAAVRAELANLYFDADRFSEAARWYEEALAIEPDDANVSTDLGICYYYLDQAPRAIRQFEASLAVDPTHTKSLLNLGIVRAFGTQDLRGAAEAWQQVVAIAPADSPEARAARQALDGLRSAHPDIVSSVESSPQGS